MSNSREQLGPFMHAVCFQYLRLNTEDVAGRAPIIAAGRKRGQEAIEDLGLLGSVTDPATMQAKLDSVLGAEGTKLCLIESITERNNGYEVRLIESACTMNQTSDEPICAFTLGVFVGAISSLTGKRMTGKERECQACGAPMCIYVIDPV